MHNINLASVMRFISIIIISLIVFFYIMQNTLIDSIVSESSDTGPRKEYEYQVRPTGTGIPEFSYDLESLFPQQLTQEIVETKIVTELIPPFAPPLLQFVGMIETNKKIIYSFRNMDTNRLLLLEEGVQTDGLTLLHIERSPAGTGGGEVFIIKKQDHTFQVDKK